MKRRALITCIALACLVPASAAAQLGGGRGGQPGNKPTQSAPIQNRTVGPRSGGGDDDNEPRATVQQRGEPTVQPPADPLLVSPEMAARIGTDTTTYAVSEPTIYGGHVHPSNRARNARSAASGRSMRSDRKNARFRS